MGLLRPMAWARGMPPTALTRIRDKGRSPRDRRDRRDTMWHLSNWKNMKETWHDQATVRSVRSVRSVRANQFDALSWEAGCRLEMHFLFLSTPLLRLVWSSRVSKSHKIRRETVLQFSSFDSLFCLHSWNIFQAFQWSRDTAFEEVRALFRCKS